MKNRKLYYIALLPWVIGVIVGSFFDYQINEAVFSKNNGFGIFFSAFAPILGYSVLAILCGYFHRFAIKEKVIWVKICYFLLSLGGMIALTIISAGHVTSVNAYDCPDWKWLWIIIEGIIFSGIFVIGDYYGKQNDDKKILYAALIFTGFVLLELVPIAQITKNLVRRPRFRICIPNDYGVQVSFANWWEPRNAEYEALASSGFTIANLSEHFKSFPSGHTGIAGILIFGLPYLQFIIPKLKGKENLLFAIGMAFTALMAFTRMLVGAHYLTDISFGAIFMVVCSIIANEINLNFFLKEESNVK